MGDMISLDFTFFIQLANLVITILVLNVLLIKPVRDQISTRTALTSGYAAQVEQFTKEASEKLSSYEKALATARVEATAAREALKAEGKAQEQSLFAATQADAQAFVQSAKVKTAADAMAAMDSLLAKVDTFAAKASAKILG